MNPYQNQTNQPLIGTDAYYQAYLAPQSETTTQNTDMYAPTANAPEKQVYQAYSPYTENQYQQPQPHVQVQIQPQPQLYTQYQAPPQQIVIQQQTQYMVQTTMPNPVPNSMFIGGLPNQANGRKPQPFHCQHCGKTQISDTRYVLGNGGLLLCCGLCIGGCWICALFPFCTEDCQDAIHSCPECQQTVGRNNFCS